MEGVNEMCVTAGYNCEGGGGAISFILCLSKVRGSERVRELKRVRQLKVAAMAPNDVLKHTHSKPILSQSHFTIGFMIAVPSYNAI